MKLRGDQLDTHLRRGIAPIYLISGDEPLQMTEATDAVREAAREAGYAQREVLDVGANFDWGQLAGVAGELSLFARQRLVELRLPGGKPGDEGSRALRAWAQRPPADCLLLIVSARIDAAAQRSKWFQELERSGVVVQLWSPKPRQLPDWIRKRMRSRGMEASQEAVALLAERVEGNLLAAAQEIDKLQLLYGARPLQAADVAAAVADSARFNIYELVDTALRGDLSRSARSLRGLQAEGVEAILVLWVLTREIRMLERMAAQLECGAHPEQVLRQQRVWEQRKPLVHQALQRSHRRHWQRLLRHAARIDRIIKGVGEGNSWDELLQLVLLMSGVSLFKGVTR